MGGMDVAVFGGGPAGLAAALALRQRGARVAVYDAQRLPIDKACGEGLLPRTVRILEQFGIVLGKDDGAEFAGVSFHDEFTTAYGAFTRGRALGVRRTRLHSRMVARAQEMGIALHWGVGVRSLAGEGFAAAGTPVHAGFFVIADGLCSTLAPAAGFHERRCSSTRYASRQPFRCTPWSDSVEIHWGYREQLYITPVGEDEVSVTLLTARPGRRLRDALSDFPAVARRLADADPTSSVRGAVTKTRTLRQILRRNVAVLGDASGSVDAITGEGLLGAFRQAHALADALVAGKPERYAVAHRQIASNPRRMATLLLLLDRHPVLRRRVIATLAAWPESFSALLRVHLGEQSWISFAANQATGLFTGQTATRNGVHPWPAVLATSGRRQERGI